MIQPQWLELPMSQINFQGPKDIRDINVLLYFILGQNVPMLGIDSVLKGECVIFLFFCFFQLRI